jgi:glucose/arabinose dehydrogenase
MNTLVVCVLCMLALAAPARERTRASLPSAASSAQATARDGRHDFDFEIGTWRTRLSRLVRPLSGSTTWATYEGTSVVRQVLNGRSNLVELTVEGRAGRIEGLSLRLYEPEPARWTIHYANSRDGLLTPPVSGRFANGRGEFFGPDTLNGRPILVRFVISDIRPNSCHFEQAFSADEGKTWEVNWIATDTRVPDSQRQ